MCVCVCVSDVCVTLTRCTSSNSILAQFLPSSSGNMGSPWPCGVDDISALRKKPSNVSATNVRPKPGDLKADHVTLSVCLYNCEHKQQKWLLNGLTLTCQSWLPSCDLCRCKYLEWTGWGQLWWNRRSGWPSEEKLAPNIWVRRVKVLGWWETFWARHPLSVV